MPNDYYKTHETVQEYIKLSEGVSGANLIEKLHPFLSKNSLLLEIGSGPGTDWGILSQQYEVIGSDNSDEFLKHLKTQNHEGEFLKLDAKTLETNQKFAGIYSNKVLHHLNDQELATSIERQNAILNPKGIICHSFWEGEGSEVFNGLFVNYHTRKELTVLFENQFEILLLEDYQEFEPRDSIILIARKK